MKDAYRTLCVAENGIPLFSQSWWLDAVAGVDGWEVVTVENDGKIIASMPYVVKKRVGFSFVGQPPLTQHLGPWLRSSDAKYAKRLGQQKDLMEALIGQLPRFGHFTQNWHHQQGNWLPFFWKGFKQTTRYTYVLPDLSDLDHVWSGLQQNIRTDIRKASERFNLSVRSDLALADFVALNRQVFERQGMKLPYSEALLERLDQACAQRACRRIFIAEDAEGRRHAAVYLVWDENSAYYLMGGGDPQLRNSGATSLCMWEAIRFAATVTKRFDFEGSMLEPVERFFRGFGAVQAPYFAVSKTPSRLLKTALFLKELRSH